MPRSPKRPTGAPAAPRTAAEAGIPAGPARPALGRTDGLALVAAIAGPLALYVLTMPRTVVLEDDGLFLMAGAHLGIAHPPGYPLHTFIVHLFMQMPFAGPAVLGHLSSAVLGALAAGAVWVCARLLGASPLPALAAAWWFGASEHVWSQAIITEVYSLHALLFFVVFALLQYGVRHPEHRRVWVAAAACYGLGLANHWPLLVLATPGLALLAAPAAKAVLRRLPLLALVAAGSAALPYAWMVWRSNQEPLISFYGPIQSLGDLWFYIARQGYAGVDASPSAGWGDRADFLLWFGHETVWQLTLPGFALAVLGLVALCRRRRALVAAGASLAAFLGQSVVLIMLLGFDFDYFNVAVMRPYSLVCYGLLALWAGFGLHVLCERVGGAKWLAPAIAGRPGFQAALAGLAGLALAATSVHSNWRVNDRSDSDLTRRYADVVFGQIDPDAVVLTYDDLGTSILGYFHFVENVLPDATLVNRQGLVFPNRLYTIKHREKHRDEVLHAFLSRTERQIASISSDPDPHCPDCGYELHGFVTEILPGAGSATLLLHVNQESDAFFRYLIDTDFADSWEYTTSRKQMLAPFGEFLAESVSSGVPALLERTESLVALCERDFYCLLGMLKGLVERWDPAHLERAKDWFAKAERLRDPARTQKKEMALFYRLGGIVHYVAGDPEGAIARFRESIAVWDHPENDSASLLEQLLDAGG